MTTSLTYETSGVPKISIAGFTRMVTPRIPFTTACTPQFIDLAAHVDVYTDAEFYADLKKASKWIDGMEEAALKEHAEGKTRKLP